MIKQGIVKPLMNGDGELVKPKKSKQDKSIIEEQEPQLEFEETSFDGEFDPNQEQDLKAIYGEISDHESESNQSNDEQGSEYYERVLAEKRKRKAEREETYEELYKPLEVEPELPVGSEEKRKASRHILVNRGLTPYRKKENRNPRVKKRIKYEKAMKKLGSVRSVAVDKSKLGKYQGETTGIKVNLAKSVKF